MSEISEIKVKFFEELEGSVAEFGWSVEALRHIESKLSLPCHYSDLIFSNLKDVLSSYADYHDKKLIQILEGQEYIPENFRGKISLALFTKLAMQNQIFAKNTLSFYLKSCDIRLALSHGWQTANQIWFWAGDNSVDYNFYTKRIILEGIYIASLQKYVNDDSPDYVGTKVFIDDIVDKVVSKLSKVKNFKLRNLPILRYFL